MSRMQVEYVLPNVSDIRQRGGLKEREELAHQFGCTYVEVPADFIKNKTEELKTGLAVGTPFLKESIPLLYSQNTVENGDIKYILHTEPAIPRTDRFGIRIQAVIKWHQPDWVNSLSTMLLHITQYFGIPAKVIEIHPGDQRNTIPDIVNGIRTLCETLSRNWGDEPLILLENRTGQVISRGSEIAELWRYITTSAPDIVDRTGIVLDIQQLFTVTRSQCVQHLEMIPPDCMRGFHIHTKHGIPSYSDPIPWSNVFSVMAKLPNMFLINPEVLKLNAIAPTIGFCKSMYGKITET